MKLGLVRRGYSRTGGAEAYLRRFAEAAEAAGHECVLFTSEWPREEWPFEHIHVGGRTPRFFADSLRLLPLQQMCDFLFSFERVWSCDVYRAGDGVHAEWLKRRARYEPRWRSWWRGITPKHRAILALEEHLFGSGGAGLVIANSEMVKAEIQQHFGYAAERIHVIRNGVPPPSLSEGTRAEVRQELGLAPDDYVLLFAGSGWERKGLRFAIAAVTRSTIKNVTLLVAGRGNPRALPSSSRVRVLGPRSDVGRVLLAADVFLLPTIYDPFSNACLEALAAGLPVITTGSNGFSEIIEPGVDGEVIAEPSDVAAVTSAIEQWSSRERREASRDRLRQIASRFSVEENLRQTLEVIAAARLNGPVEQRRS